MTQHMIIRDALIGCGEDSTRSSMSGLRWSFIFQAKRKIQLLLKVVDLCGELVDLLFGRRVGLDGSEHTEMEMQRGICREGEGEGVGEGEGEGEGEGKDPGEGEQERRGLTFQKGK